MTEWEFMGEERKPISHDVINRKKRTFSQNQLSIPPELNPQMWTHLSKNLLAQLNMEASGGKSLFPDPGNQYQ
ncbi:MAG: hypothetical protein R3B93_09370 [Bacteroidia bacterium]